MEIGEKHYLDSSILVKIMSGTKDYKRYLQEKIKNSQSYVTDYVQMELRRGTLSDLMDFYSVLMNSKSLSDANRLWTNRFGKRKLAVVASFMSDVLDEDPSLASSKDISLKYLALQIRRKELFIRCKYKNPGNDSTHCPKPKIALGTRSDNLDAEADCFEEFISNFSDNQKCRSQCNLEHFLSVKFRRQIDSFIELSKSSYMDGKRKEGKGFSDICIALEGILATEGRDATCTTCSKIGDAIIALLAPNDMQIEHTDRSFDFLCQAINKTHRRLESEQVVIRRFIDSSS